MEKKPIPVFRSHPQADAAVRLAVSYAQEHFDEQINTNQPIDPNALEDERGYFLNKYAEEWVTLLETALDDSVYDHFQRRGWDEDGA